MIILIILTLGAGIIRRKWIHPLIYAIIATGVGIFQLQFIASYRAEAGLQTNISSYIINTTIMAFIVAFLFWGIGLLISRYLLTKTYWPEKLKTTKN